MQLVVHDRLRHAWPICDAHAACTEVQEVKIMLRCMDSLFECSSLVIPPIMD